MLRFHTARVLVLASLLALPIALPAQSGVTSARDTTSPSKTFFTRKDLAYSAVAFVGSAELNAFDVRIRNWSQSASVQGSESREETIENFTRINELPLTLAAIGTYGIGRISHNNTITDVGMHVTEAMVLTVAVSELVRIPVGRTRPRTSPGDQYDFHFGGGLTHFDERSFRRCTRRPHLPRRRCSAES
ncbi:MAG: hypothetical protein ABIT20_15545 [Gemmatimonadaceae bacterium]